MNLLTKQKQTHRLREMNLWLPEGKDGRERQIGSLGWIGKHCYISNG